MREMRCSMYSVSGSDDEPLDLRPGHRAEPKLPPSNAASPRCSPVTGRYQPNRDSGRAVAVEPKSTVRAPPLTRNPHPAPMDQRC